MSKFLNPVTSLKKKKRENSIEKIEFRISSNYLFDNENRKNSLIDIQYNKDEIAIIDHWNKNLVNNQENII